MSSSDSSPDNSNFRAIDNFSSSVYIRYSLSAIKFRWFLTGWTFNLNQSSVFVGITFSSGVSCKSGFSVKSKRLATLLKYNLIHRLNLYPINCLLFTCVVLRSSFQKWNFFFDFFWIFFKSGADLKFSDIDIIIFCQMILNRLLTRIGPIVKARYTTLTIPKPQKLLHLSNLKVPRNSFKKRKRIGRGGQKRTAGRGRKGYKMRHSTARNIKSYEGGQSTLVRKIPKFGIQKRQVLLKQKRHLRPLYLDSLEQFIKLNRIDPTKPISIKTLVQSGICGKVKDGIVLLQRVISL